MTEKMIEIMDGLIKDITSCGRGIEDYDKGNCFGCNERSLLIRNIDHKIEYILSPANDGNGNIFIKVVDGEAHRLYKGNVDFHVQYFYESQSVLYRIEADGCTIRAYTFMPNMFAGE